MDPDSDSNDKSTTLGSRSESEPASESGSESGSVSGLKLRSRSES